jgi:hypothetical protein
MPSVPCSCCPPERSTLTSLPTNFSSLFLSIAPPSKAERTSASSVYTLSRKEPMNPTDAVQDRLANLLAERKLLRHLSQDLTRCLALADREQAHKIEQRISELVQGTLNLSKRESMAAHFLADAVRNLIDRSNTVP